MWCLQSPCVLLSDKFPIHHEFLDLPGLQPDPLFWFGDYQILLGIPRMFHSYPLEHLLEIKFIDD